MLLYVGFSFSPFSLEVIFAMRSACRDDIHASLRAAATRARGAARAARHLCRLRRQRAALLYAVARKMMLLQRRLSAVAVILAAPRRVRDVRRRVIATPMLQFALSLFLLLMPSLRYAFTPAYFIYAMMSPPPC